MKTIQLFLFMIMLGILVMGAKQTSVIEDYADIQYVKGQIVKPLTLVPLTA